MVCSYCVRTFLGHHRHGAGGSRACKTPRHCLAQSPEKLQCSTGQTSPYDQVHHLCSRHVHRRYHSTDGSQEQKAYAIQVTKSYPTGGLTAVSRLDLARTCRMAAFGAVVSGPIGHVWFTALDKVLMSHTVCGDQ